MRILPKALLTAGASILLLTGVASAAPAAISTKIVYDEPVAKRVATIFSTPLAKGENPFTEVFEVEVKLPPPPPEPEPEVASSNPSSPAVVESSSEEPASRSSGSGEGTTGLYSVDDLMFMGVINWGGYKFTYYSQSVLPGGGLVIPGRHVSADGFVVDGDGYIALAGDAPKGTVYATPFGRSGKIYDRGTYGNHLDVYTR